MGLFKFLKKERELEAPPPPPLFEAKTIPELPPFPEMELPSLEELPKESAVVKPKSFVAELPPFPAESSLVAGGQELPSFPGEVESELREIESKVFPKPRLKLLEEVLPKRIKPSVIIEEAKELEREAIGDEKKVLHAREELLLEKPIFVEGMNFRRILGSISEAHSLLQDNEEHLGHWAQEEENKDAHLEHFRVALEQAQRKLIYVDKILFE